jgi:hypothetical protein
LSQLEEAVVDEELKAGLIDDKTSVRRRLAAWSRSSSAGDDLWHQVNKARFEDTGAVRLINVYGGGISGLLSEPL